MNYSQTWLKLLGHKVFHEPESCLMLGKGLVGNQMIIGKVSVFDMLSIISNDHESRTIDDI